MQPIKRRALGRAVASNDDAGVCGALALALATLPTSDSSTVTRMINIRQ